MRVRSKNHAMELRNNGAKFYNQFGNQVQAPSQGLVRIDFYKAALKHLLNTIDSFDYLFEAQIGALENKVSTVETEKRRLEREVVQLQQALRLKNGEAVRRNRQPEKPKKVSTESRQERPSSSKASHSRKASARGSSQGSAALLIASSQEAPGNRTAYTGRTLPNTSAALLRYLLHGQRNFLDQHSDAGVAGALSFLIQHALTQLQAAPEARSRLMIQQAMYANLYTISKKLCIYKGRVLNGFQSALEELETRIPGIQDLASTLPAKRKRRSEAKLFQETLKLLRDQARLDFRPYFYEIDPHEGVVFAVG